MWCHGSITIKIEKMYKNILQFLIISINKHKYRVTQKMSHLQLQSNVIRSKMILLKAKKKPQKCTVVLLVFETFTNNHFDRVTGHYRCE